MREKIRILFIGEIISTHAQSWIKLLSNNPDFEVLVLDIGAKWDQSKFGFKTVSYHPENIIEKILKRIPITSINHLRFRKWLSFKPHIVHTLGLFPASELYLKHIIKDAKWVAQTRGGPDLAMNKDDPQFLPAIKAILAKCDHFIADNDLNYKYAVQLGLPENKKAPFGIVPGTGGVDLEAFASTNPPSKKEQMILWPKAYNCIQSDGFVVIEGLRRAILKNKTKIKIIATAAMPDVTYWLKQLIPTESCELEIFERIPRDKLLDYYHRSRVLLAPSLNDGIPNTLYEAMASRTVPIISPIETLKYTFKNGDNVIFASNLDPEEICSAILEGLNDDELADRISNNNMVIVNKMANKKLIAIKVSDFYRDILS